MSDSNQPKIMCDLLKIHCSCGFYILQHFKLRNILKNYIEYNPNIKFYEYTWRCPKCGKLNTTRISIKRDDEFYICKNYNFEGEN